MKTKRFYTPRQSKMISGWIERLSFDEGERFLVFYRMKGYRPTDYVYRTFFEELLKAFWRKEKAY